MSARQLLSCLAISGSFLATSPVHADLVIGSASATGLETNLELVAGVVELGIAPTPFVTGTAPDPFNVNDSILSVSDAATVDIPGLGPVPVVNLSSGVIDVNAMSDVDGGPGARSSSAMSTVNDIQFNVDNIDELLAISTLVSLEAAAIQSMAMVSGPPGALAASASAQLAGSHGDAMDQALLTVAGVEFLLDTAPAANTQFTIDGSVVPGLTGSIGVFLNEQTQTGDLMVDGSVTVNALRLNFNNVGISLGPLPPEQLNGDLIIGRTSAMLATPEPSSLSLCGIFLVATGWMRGRRLWAGRAGHEGP